VATDNHEEFFSVKVKIREMVYKQSTIKSILEVYGGNGLCWRQVSKNIGTKIKTTRIDKRQGLEGIYIVGDSLKVIAGLNLQTYDIIDIDAYGSPYDILEFLFKKKYKGFVICTDIVVSMGATANILMKQSGISKEMIKCCPSIYRKIRTELINNYLTKNGVKKINIFSQNDHNYYYFELK
jgi:tRNA G26 N,N-dimethylase Trm1